MQHLDADDIAFEAIAAAVQHRLDDEPQECRELR